MLSAQAIAAPRRWSIPIPQWDSVWSEIVRLVKYQLVGFSNSVVSFLVLNAFYFLWAPTSPLILVLGSSAAYAAGDLNSYWWNGRWTFGGGKHSWTQAGRFALLSLVFILINAALVWGSAGWLLTLALPVWLVHSLPQIIMSVTGSLGYVICRLWVFK